MIQTGIDLGTTNSAIAHVNVDGIATLIPDAVDRESFHTPFVVHVGPSGCLVGSPVEDMLEDQPDMAVARHTKWLLGNSAAALRDHMHRDWSPEAIAALMLIKLRQDAESACYESFGEAVISVPNQFGDAQRRAVRHAADLAGVAVRSLVDESVAAATFVTAQSQREQTILVYALGGGSFDATLLHCSPAQISVLATEGQIGLGGMWIDERIMRLLHGEFKRVSGGGELSATEQLQLRRLAERTKHRLNVSGNTQLRENTLIGSQPFEFLLTRKHFDRLIEPMATRSMAITERCLAAAQLSWLDVDQIVLVGGCTHVPAIKRCLSQQSGKRETEFRQPAAAVAFGAALLAADAQGELRRRVPALKQSVASFDLGVRIRDLRSGELAIYKMIKRNSPLPATASKILRTSRDEQTRMVVEVAQSGEDPSQALSLGHFVFGPIAAPRKNHPIEISMHCNHEGIVTVSARDPNNGQHIAHSLSQEDLPTNRHRADVERDLIASEQVNA